jgi:hypothetical protein
MLRVPKSYPRSSATTSWPWPARGLLLSTRSRRTSGSAEGCLHNWMKRADVADGNRPAQPLPTLRSGVRRGSEQAAPAGERGPAPSMISAARVSVSNLFMIDLSEDWPAGLRCWRHFFRVRPRRATSGMKQVAKVATICSARRRPAVGSGWCWAQVNGSAAQRRACRGGPRASVDVICLAQRSSPSRSARLDLDLDQASRLSLRT